MEKCENRNGMGKTVVELKLLIKSLGGKRYSKLKRKDLCKLLVDLQTDDVSLRYITSNQLKILLLKFNDTGYGNKKDLYKRWKLKSKKLKTEKLKTEKLKIKKLNIKKLKTEKLNLFKKLLKVRDKYKVARQKFDKLQSDNTFAIYKLSIIYESRDDPDMNTVGTYMFDNIRYNNAVDVTNKLKTEILAEWEKVRAIGHELETIESKYAQSIIEEYVPVSSVADLISAYDY